MNIKEHVRVARIKAGIPLDSQQGLHPEGPCAPLSDFGIRIEKEMGPLTFLHRQML